MAHKKSPARRFFLIAILAVLFIVAIQSTRSLWNDNEEASGPSLRTLRQLADRNLQEIPDQARDDKEDNRVTPALSPIVTPNSYTIANEYHIFQTFNNCGPAALSMALSYYDITVSQAELGQQLRPYQVAGGDNDDKSVTLAEVAAKAEEYDLKSYRRPNGTPEMLEQFIANDIPVIVRTWLKVDDDIGHYRIVKGYNKTTKQFLQDDSLQGKDLWYSYADFDVIWDKFNYEYVVLAPADKVQVVGQILGEDSDEKTAWAKAAERSRTQLQQNPNDIDAGFNLSVALYNGGDYSGSVEAFEKVQARLPARTLWYQIEPLHAYMQLEEYDKVLQITENILNNNNRAFSELYILRGDIYKTRGDTAAARAEYQQAVKYNESLQLAKDRLSSM